MRPSTVIAIRPCLETAIRDIKRWLARVEEHKRIMGRLGRALHRLAADQLCSTSGRHKKRFPSLSPSWMSSAREAAVSLTNVEWKAEANGIREELGKLPPDIREKVVAWLPNRDTLEAAAKRILEILVACLAGLNDQDEGSSPAAEPASVTQTATTSRPTLSLVSLYTNGVSDERLRCAEAVLQNDNLTVNEKLVKIDAAFPIPTTASAMDLAKSLGVSKTAVLKTCWWNQNRKGERDNEIGRRRDRHRERANQCE